MEGTTMEELRNKAMELLTKSLERKGRSVHVPENSDSILYDTPDLLVWDRRSGKLALLIVNVRMSSDEFFDEADELPSQGRFEWMMRCCIGDIEHITKAEASCEIVLDVASITFAAGGQHAIMRYRSDLLTDRAA